MSSARAIRDAAPFSRPDRPFAPTEADIGRAIIYKATGLPDTHGTITGIKSETITWVLFRHAGGQIQVFNFGLYWPPERKPKCGASKNAAPDPRSPMEGV